MRQEETVGTRNGIFGSPHSGDASPGKNVIPFTQGLHLVCTLAGRYTHEWRDTQKNFITPAQISHARQRVLTALLFLDPALLKCFSLERAIHANNAITVLSPLSVVGDC